MENWEDKSTNDILMTIKQMEQDYNAIKDKIDTELDIMDYMDKEFLKARAILSKRQVI